MKIAFLVQHSVEENHRTRRMLKICEELGETSFVSFKSPEKYSNCNFYKIKSKLLIYHYMRKYLKQIKPDVVMIHDHICAPIIPFIKNKVKPKLLIYDMSELYLRVSPNATFIGDKVMKFFLYCAKKNVRKADIVITANEDRALITRGYYMCDKMPLVFENVHKIETEYDKSECDRKYSQYFFNPEVFTAVFAGGVSKKRMTERIVESFVSLGDKYQLLVLGKKDDHYFEMLARKYSAFCDNSNVKYLGFVSQEDLKYLYDKSSINIITYEQNNLNNIYCASGRLFESLFCGIPFVSSNNPPLVKMAEKYQIGIYTENEFEKAVKEIHDKYSYYKENVALVLKDIDPAVSEKKLCEKLKHIIYQSE